MLTQKILMHSKDFTVHEVESSWFCKINSHELFNLTVDGIREPLEGFLDQSDCLSDQLLSYLLDQLQASVTH